MFEWDDDKDASNQIKHGVSFYEAVSVFFDPRALDGPDVLHSRSELRYLRVGRVLDGRVLTVCYTLRKSKNGKKKVRIISARTSSKKERAAYE